MLIIKEKGLCCNSSIIGIIIGVLAVATAATILTVKNEVR